MVDITEENYLPTADSMVQDTPENEQKDLKETE